LLILREVKQTGPADSQGRYRQGEKMKKQILTTDIENAFGWRFKNVPKLNRGEIERTEERLNQLHSDINIGFEQNQRELLLKHLEGLTRKNVIYDLIIPLHETPKDSPHHLDNENEIIKFEKISFKELVISRIDKGRKVEIKGSTIKLSLDYNAMTDLFTKIYVCMEIYATQEDNIVILQDIDSSKIRLVIWGVINDKPIYY
jgi:hypothetical protein